VNKGGLTAAFAGLALVVMGVFPPLALEDTYGEVAVPGSANLHLPAGEVDVTLRSVAPTDEPSVPPLSIRVSGPDGISRAEVVENRRTTSVSWVFFICVVGVVLSAAFGTVLGLLIAVSPFLLASAVRKLLSRPSVNL
jgi:hypothetical protein